MEGQIVARKRKVLFVSAECEPYARTGGLGDVSAAYPNALASENVSVIRVMPLYRCVERNVKYKLDFPIRMGKGYQTCVVKADYSDRNVVTYFIGNDYYYNKDWIYGYYEDGERFLFFCKAVVKLLKSISFQPDIVHCNDWHTGFIPMLLKLEGLHTKSVYTIHNLRYTGYIGADYLWEYPISWDELQRLKVNDVLNFTKAGLYYSDAITTVSRQYAKDITTPEYGEGYDGILRERKKCIRGIQNGIDIEIYNSNKASIPFDINDMAGKKENKKLLFHELGFSWEDQIEDLPLVSVISRLDDQKGINLIVNMIRKTDLTGYRVVILGTGNSNYEKELTELAERYPGRMKVVIAFDGELAKRIYAGSDIFLMPSLFEPGGLGQLIAMAYGTVPVVRSTGGLKDTVIDVKEDSDNGNGFCFKKYSVNALIGALNRAFDAYRTSSWEQIMKNGMQFEKSWQYSVKQYLQLYKDISKPI